MIKTIVRTNKWLLQADDEVKRHLLATVKEYFAYCKVLRYIVLGNWQQL